MLQLKDPNLLLSRLPFIRGSFSYLNIGGREQNEASLIPPANRCAGTLSRKEWAGIDRPPY